MNKLKVYVYECPAIGHQARLRNVYFGFKARCYVILYMLFGKLRKGIWLEMEHKNEGWPWSVSFKGETP